ncbi:HNH endonuclease family protein [Streptomyces spiramyceticus]|uniref:HNH endonuclease family protein n=1 Tax=Streptomyces spiramyceticus TaxID=299717 RepID=UPI00237A88D6|nr:HNH endonuclease family protein [Streptomyces spiramyceticus]
MIKLTGRALVGAALALLPLIGTTPAQAAAPRLVSLTEGIRAIPLGAESREGYTRTSFRHWIDEDRDGCSTRAEVLIAESRAEPTIEAGCKVTKGVWFSYYDELIVTDPSGLDVDHMVPLAEAWDSGASQWTADRRRAYANDLGADQSLVAVTAKTNRSKADQDPAQWLPPSADARCTYASEWTATKLRWHLTADRDEQAALLELAEGCGDTLVEYEPAP